MRRAAVLAALAAVGVLAGCVGDTRPATNVRATQAQLNAYGRTDNGPAYWWWEYATTRRAVDNGQGTKTARQGPASSPTNVSLNTVIKNLDSAQTYYFRACGQDQKAGSPAVCGTTHHFGTAPADSIAAVTDGGGGHTFVKYSAAPATAHDLVLTGAPNTATIREYEEQDSKPLYGADIIPGPGCSSFRSDPALSYYDTVSCTSNENNVTLNLSGYDDYLSNQGTMATSGNLGGGSDVYSAASEVEDDLIHGEAGNDYLYGSGHANYYYGDDGGDTINGYGGADELHGGAGVDGLSGGDGDDQIWGGPGIDGYDCGPGNDVIHVGVYDEWGFHSTNCESYVIDDPQ